MGVSMIQPSFASGELAPSLYARVDLARYGTGLRLCSNFFVMPYGGVKNRAGTAYVNDTKSGGVARLIPFKFNDEQTYVLEFGNLYMRVYRNGGVVLNTSGPNVGLPFELVTPYTAADLFDLNYTQSADVMTIVHPSYEPRELSRLANDNWTLSVISFVPAVATPTGQTATASNGGSGSTTAWTYQITAVKDDGGILDESLPATTATVNVFNNAPDVFVTWTAVTGASYYNLYKDNSSSGVFGFVGRSSTTSFFDRNITPVKTDAPPTGVNPFVGAGNYPGAVGYYQQRLCFAGTDNGPQTVWMSKTGAFKNFGKAIPIKDDDAITFTIAAQTVNRFRHLLPLRQLLGLTTGGEWLIRGADSGLTPKTVQAEVQSYNGSSKIPPIVVNNSAIYIQSRGNRVSSLAYSFQADGFSGDDLTKYSPHFFRGYDLIDWTYQQEPDRLVWAARSDGALLGMTFLPEEQLIAWHQHHTDGIVESVCAIPEGGEDALYLVVRRTINGASERYIERMASRQINDIEDAFFVDCGLTYDGRNKVADDYLTLSGGTTWEYPEVVTLTATGHTPFSVGSVGRTYRLRAGSEMVRVEITAYTSTSVVSARLTEVCPASLRGVPVSDWALMAETISGLGHLEGKSVSVLTDGDVHPPQVVASGSIVLQYPAAVVHAGLPYNAELETLDVEFQGQETVLDKRKVIPGVTLYLEASRNFKAGRDKNKVYEQKAGYRQTYDSAIPLVTGVSELKINTAWSESGRIYVQQPDPLPLTILAIIPDVVISGKG